ncbi:hypothetical protein J6590_020432 [Homalodisca vitripennis]|nr:hypothetical protein J6590_020432 [Homalodisca vitripennis]
MLEKRQYSSLYTAVIRWPVQFPESNRFLQLNALDIVSAAPNCVCRGHVPRSPIHRLKHPHSSYIPSGPSLTPNMSLLVSPPSAESVAYLKKELDNARKEYSNPLNHTIETNNRFPNFTDTSISCKHPDTPVWTLPQIDQNTQKKKYLKRQETISSSNQTPSGVPDDDIVGDSRARYLAGLIKRRVVMFNNTVVSGAWSQTAKYHIQLPTNSKDVQYLNRGH